MFENGNWKKDTKESLEKLLNENAYQQKKVIFDFDNTVISRDIGEATFALLVKNNLIDTEKVKIISPDFMYQDKLISLNETVDLIEYYEYFMLATNHHQFDEFPAVNAYIWLVQIMNFLTPYDIINISKQAFADNIAKNDRINKSQTKITVNNNDFLLPFFHDEMVDFIGDLIKLEYDIYFVSASNVWTIRYMVIKELNNLIQKKFGNIPLIKPENVFGISMLLQNKNTKILCKDECLIREDSQEALLYKNIDNESLKNYILTNQPSYPCPAFDGKIATIRKYILKENEKPFLIAGDSMGDYSMLKMSENKLWMAKLEKNELQQFIKKQSDENWLIQPVLYKDNAGFIGSESYLSKIFNEKIPDNIYKSNKILF